MRTHGKFAVIRLGIVIAAVSILTACTKGGQFDPTTLLDNDMFDNKTPLKGQREPVFPGGVPGVTTGIPADLYKGYQPPPEQAADNGGAATPILPPGEQQANSEARVEPKEKAKTKPKKVVRAPAKKRRTEISVGLSKRAKPTSRQAEQSSQTAWPAPPPTNQSQSSQTAWPAPPPTNQSQSSQTAWPAPPPTAAAQSSQSIWPAPPPTGAQ